MRVIITFVVSSALLMAPPYCLALAWNAVGAPMTGWPVVSFWQAMGLFWPPIGVIAVIAHRRGGRVP